jgi:DNA replication ATP-dependent helicase Dna2
MEVIQEEPLPADEGRRSSGSSDEFGDDDFDADMVEALDISQQAVQQVASDETVQGEQHTLPPLAQPPAEESPAGLAIEAGSDDEFGLDDEQDFAADLEQVASLYDSRPEAASLEGEHVLQNDQEAPVTDVAPVIDLDEDDSDEFGDDIDPDEFAAAELQATQGYNTVCKARHNT